MMENFKSWSMYIIGIPEGEEIFSVITAKIKNFPNQ